MKLKKVCIIGKTNVGKSQLFNRIIGHRHSVVMETPGITRDRISMIATWLKYSFFITDTGGYSDKLNAIDFQEQINKQTKSAIDESDLILFVVSKKDGIDQDDRNIRKIILQSKKPVILAVNKYDCAKGHDFSQAALGFGEGINISAEHGINIGTLLDNIVDNLNIFNEKPVFTENTVTKFAIIGKPNVGKSSLCNALLKDERLIVSPISGTTHDAVDVNFSYRNSAYTLIDTPGIKKSRWNTDKSKFEQLLILKAKQSIARADVICFVMDLTDNITSMDETIARLILKANIPTIIVANKWDAINYKSDMKKQELEKIIRANIPFLSWVPIVFVSAQENHKLENIFKALYSIKIEMSTVFSDKDLKNFLIKIVYLFNVPRVSNQKVELYNIKQVKSQILTFLINCNNIDYLHFSYERMIENKFRETFNIKFSPLKFYYRSKKIND